MRLGDFLRSGGGARAVNPRPVELTVIGENGEMRTMKGSLKAVITFVDEDRRERLRVDAAADLAKRFEGKTIPPSVIRDEETYRLLFEALREAEPNEAGHYARLCDNVTELRASLILPEAQRLSAEYDRFVEDEYPPKISDADFSAMVEDAKKNSASDLLSKYGYEPTVAVLRSLVGRSG